MLAKLNSCCSRRIGSSQAAFLSAAGVNVVRACVLLLLTLLGISAAPVSTRCEEPPPAPADKTADSAASGVSPAAQPARAALAPPTAANSGDEPAGQLDTFMLRDSKGNLVPVLGLTFEEFQRLLRSQQRLTAPPK